MQPILVSCEAPFRSNLKKKKHWSSFIFDMCRSFKYEIRQKWRPVKSTYTFYIANFINIFGEEIDDQSKKLTGRDIGMISYSGTFGSLNDRAKMLSFLLKSWFKV